MPSEDALNDLPVLSRSTRAYDDAAGDLKGCSGVARGDARRAMTERAARLGCVNRARPHRCAQRSTAFVVAGEVDDLFVLTCPACGWPIASYGLVVILDNRDVEPSLHARIEAACEALGIATQDEIRARHPRGHKRSNRSEVRAGFDERGKHWEKNRGAITETFGTSNRLKRIVADALARSTMDQPTSLADFGCGTGGLLASAIAMHGLGRFAGVDASAVMIDRAAERLAAIPQDPTTIVDLVVAGADASPLPTGAFDIVSSELSLHHVDDAGRVLSEMARVAKSGGAVLVQVPGPGYTLDANHGRGWKPSRFESKTLPAELDPLGRFGVGELQALSVSAGLEPTHVDVDPWRYQFTTVESCLAFLGRTGADARVRGYTTPLDLLEPYAHVLDVGPVELRGEFVTLTAVKVGR